jgi:lipopolysaccharide/colanic/teichoic acid biosynthesis glycosyltransferase
MTQNPIELDPFPLPVRYLLLRSILERSAVLLLLPLLLPVAAAIALAIRLDSPGPALFRQQRPGRGGRTFRIVKFRTMYLNDCGSLPVRAGDSRVTRIGRLLRAYHLDELPQLWNVLRGDIGIIGPRPLPLAMEERFGRAIPGYEARYHVPPGITGWAQINQGYTDDIEGARRKLELDLFYIENLSPRLDMTILVRTVGAVVQQRGAR